MIQLRAGPGFTAEQALRGTLGITIEDPDAASEARYVTLVADSLE